MTRFLVYGANGYTGHLIALEAKRRNLEFTIAGRNAAEIEPLAAELGVGHQVAGLDDPTRLDRLLEGHHAVLHCAGPFSRTSAPVADACLRRGVHYLDITGEIAVYEALASRDRAARERGITLLPGVGFDVVPTDCLALHLKQRLPTATHLWLAFHTRGGISRGTALTSLERIGGGGMVRQDGRLRPVPAAWKTRWVDFGDKKRLTVTIPWGDVATSWYSTGIPNVEVYLAARPPVVRALRWSRWFGPVMRLPPIRGLLAGSIRRRGPGPSDQARASGYSVVVGEAFDGSSTVRARFRGPEGYTFTALAAVLAVSRVARGNAPTGFQTPARAFGPDFALEIPGTVRDDL